MRLGALLTILNPGLDTACEGGSPVQPFEEGDSKIELTPTEWRKRLTPDQFHVLRERGSTALARVDASARRADGSFACVGCGAAVFDGSAALVGNGSTLQFHSTAYDGALVESLDSRHGLLRVAISCCRCESHLGHVKLDPTSPSGKRYVPESVALANHRAN